MTPPFPDKKYSVIYADPPWFHEAWANGKHRPSLHYPVMPTGEIATLPVGALSEKSAVLFLWATLPHLQEALEVMMAWGFTYKTGAFVWVKENRVADGLFKGMGSYTMSNAELCLVGTKGKGLKRKDRSVRQVVICPRSHHSEKPAEVRDRIVKLYGDVPRIELFARQRVPGWDAWGLEVPEA